MNIYRPNDGCGGCDPCGKYPPAARCPARKVPKAPWVLRAGLEKPGLPVPRAPRACRASRVPKDPKGPLAPPVLKVFRGFKASPV